VELKRLVLRKNCIVADFGNGRFLVIYYIFLPSLTGFLRLPGGGLDGIPPAVSGCLGDWTGFLRLPGGA
jgi:hypothetical protein